MDPLSSVLFLLKPQTQFCAGVDFGGDWSFAFPPEDGVKFTAILKGRCCGLLDGAGPPMHFEAGESYLLNRRGITLCSDPSLAPLDSSGLIATALDKGIAVHNGGGDVLIISSLFKFGSNRAALLFDALPPIIRARRDSSQAEVLRWCLDQLAQELRSCAPGTTLASGNLMQLMLVHILRLHLASSSPASLSIGWLHALSDRQIGKALQAMHAEPSRPWHLQDLAREAGMSRTVFAQQFKSKVGRSPMDYLAHWRMLIASDHLREGQQSISSIAYSLGYQSEAAFSTAFKKMMSMPPLHYRRLCQDKPAAAEVDG